MTVAATGEDVDRAGAEHARYLTFTLNGESYALDIFHVTEIIEYRPLTVVPMAPDFVRGVINLRGRAVPVVDLAIRFGHGATAVAKRTSIIIVHIREAPGAEPSAGAGDGQDVGILVDMVSKVVAFRSSEVEPAPPFGSGIRADFINGMARRDGGFIIVLDLGRIMSVTDLPDLDDPASPSPGAPAFEPPPS